MTVRKRIALFALFTNLALHGTASAATDRISSRGVVAPAHGGFLTGHFEFDAAIVLIFFGIMTYSFLLPEDSPRGLARRAIQALAILLCASALVLAVIGMRRLVLGTI